MGRTPCEDEGDTGVNHLPPQEEPEAKKGHGTVSGTLLWQP